MDLNVFFKIAERIVGGKEVSYGDYEAIADLPAKYASSLFPGAELIRNHFFGRKVHLCTICNGKSGRCSEDCSFCSQSGHSNSDVPVYPLLPPEELLKYAGFSMENGIDRFSVVTSGKGVSESDLEKLCDFWKSLKVGKTQFCASLGILNREKMEMLKAAGVSRYHHNLETAESHFAEICTTHTYEERVATIKAARDAGLSVCSGGIFGVGETDRQILEMALALKELDVDAVPVNFLIPAKGTPLEGKNDLSPMRCLKIISLFRYVLPEKDIFICGGREANLKALHPFVFYAGASGVMTGNYLTASGRSLNADLKLLEDLEMTVRADC